MDDIKIPYHHIPYHPIPSRPPSHSLSSHAIRYKEYKKPIWINEFACPPYKECGPADQLAFMKVPLRFFLSSSAAAFSRVHESKAHSFVCGSGSPLLPPTLPSLFRRHFIVAAEISGRHFIEDHRYAFRQAFLNGRFQL